MLLGHGGQDGHLCPDAACIVAIRMVRQQTEVVWAIRHVGLVSYAAPSTRGCVLLQLLRSTSMLSYRMRKEYLDQGTNDSCQKSPWIFFGTFAARKNALGPSTDAFYLLSPRAFCTRFGPRWACHSSEIDNQRPEANFTASKRRSGRHVSFPATKSVKPVLARDDLTRKSLSSIRNHRCIESHGLHSNDAAGRLWVPSLLLGFLEHQTATGTMWTTAD